MSNETTHFIGQCLWDPSILDKTRLEASHFDVGVERDIFTAMLSITREGGVADEGPVAKASGIPISTIMEFKAIEILPGNWEFYEKQIRQDAQKRNLNRAIEKVLHSVGNSPQDDAALLQEAIDGISDNLDGFEISDIKQTVMSTMDAITKRARDGNRIIGISSGLRALDDMTLGFQPRRLYYFGARPSQGKTALLLNFIGNCSVSCGVLSAESGKEELVTRMLAKGAGVDSQRLALGIFRTGEDDRLGRAASRLYEHPETYLYDAPNMTIDTAVRTAKQMKRRYDIQALFVDYLQCLAPSPGMAARPNYEQVAYASKQMKMLARTLEIPVIVAAQLRRDAEGTRPTLRDFSDSGQIERDADVAVFIHNDTKTNMTYLLIEKNRDGRTGDILVKFNKPLVSFEEALP